MELPKRHDIVGTDALLSVIMVNSNVEEACVECRGGSFLLLRRSRSVLSDMPSRSTDSHVGPPVKHALMFRSP